MSATRTKNPGRRFAQVVKLKKECVDQYKACHAAVWPEVAQQIKQCGIEDCKWATVALGERGGRILTRRRQHLLRRHYRALVRHLQVHWVRLRGRHGAHGREPQGARVVEDDGQFPGEHCAWGCQLRGGRAELVEANGGGVLSSLDVRWMRERISPASRVVGFFEIVFGSLNWLALPWLLPRGGPDQGPCSNASVSQRA